MSTEKPKKRERVKLYEDDLPFDTENGQRSNGTTSSGIQHPSSGGCSQLETKFVWHYLATYRNAERAAILAGISPRRAYGKAMEWLRTGRVQALIMQMELDTLRRLQVDVDLVVKGQYIRATTPVTECFDVVIPPCRFCWGVNNEYQRTHEEMERDLDKHLEAMRRWNAGRKREVDKPAPFDEKGGIGYDMTRDANPECPNCHGNPQSIGVKPVSMLKPTADMSLAGKMMLAGARVKDGNIEYLMRDADQATAHLMSTLRESWQVGRDEDRQVLQIRPHGPLTGERRITRVQRTVVTVERRDAVTEPDNAQD